MLVKCYDRKKVKSLIDLTIIHMVRDVEVANLRKKNVTSFYYCGLGKTIVKLDFFFTLFLTLGARLHVLGPFHMGGAFGSNT